MHAAVRSIQEYVAVRAQAEQLPSPRFTALIHNLDSLTARRRHDYRFLSICIVELNMVPTRGHDPLDEVPGDLVRDELNRTRASATGRGDRLYSRARRVTQARGDAHPIPERPDDVWPLGVSVFKRHQHFVSYLRHEHKPSPAAGARRHHPGPGGGASFHPIVLNLNSPHVSQIVVRHHPRRRHAADPLWRGLFGRGVIFPGSAGELIAVAVSLIVVMDDLDQAIIALRVEAETCKMDLVPGLQAIIPAFPMTQYLRADRAGALLLQQRLIHLKFRRSPVEGEPVGWQMLRLAAHRFH